MTFPKMLPIKDALKLTEPEKIKEELKARKELISQWSGRYILELYLTKSFCYANYIPN